MSKYTPVALDEFQDVFGSTSTEISSAALGGRIVAVSDEFFAEAYHLLKVEPAPSLKGQFGPKGALFSGWETRRHNPTYDWCIIKLGAPGHIMGFDIDTSHFNGNEAPQASVEALFSAKDDPTVDAAWTEILPKVNLGPSSRHLFQIEKTECSYTHVKLKMYPDGGIARFRVYGLVSPIFPPVTELIDLAHVMSGGRVVFTSDQHFGIGPNLLLPGRGKDMGDGWETRRSRKPGHKDWVIIRLGDAGLLEQVEIDTAHFMGNFPESCILHATYCDETVPSEEDESKWTVILPRTKLGPHRRHFFQLENVHRIPYTHVRLTIFPDGGVKRVRVLGRRHQGHKEIAERVAHEPTVSPYTVSRRLPEVHDIPRMEGNTLVNEATGTITPTYSDRDVPSIPAVPLTPEAFAPFGDVIQGWEDPNGAPKGVKVTSANQGTAHKFHRLSLVKSSYPDSVGDRAVTGISVFRSTPVGAKPGQDWEVKLLERHSYTAQTFIPMGNTRISSLGMEDALEKSGRGYLVIVALNGEDDRPDLNTLRAFIASNAQGITYHTGIWHHPMITLESPIDFACVETQIGTPGEKMDCELVSLEELGGVKSALPSVRVPLF
ncbi:Allantoicase [Tulasnella sp. 418]|nr:Allantoicase [Tulasnella sp. 418]